MSNQTAQSNFLQAIEEALYGLPPVTNVTGEIGVGIKATVVVNQKTSGDRKSVV